jgi:membrane protease YdiL (CAAX protease family)
MNNEQKKEGLSANSTEHPVLSPTAERGVKTGSTVFRRLPQRYIVNESNDGRFLTCLEAPNISVHVEAGLTVSASAAYKSLPGTIYLDGAAACEPFMNLEKQIYNFDHHEGCVRPFTLSTCEQVLIMILKGLDLRGRDWKVFANEPDLDTVMAIWLIFNHVRVSGKHSAGLRRLYALVRLEGVIDAHGLEMAGLSAFPPELLKKTKKLIDYLRAEEVSLKKSAIWEETDYLEYTALILHKIDRIIYKSDDFSDFKELKELARAEIGDHRIAVVVEAELGIYELEPYLNRIYGESLGLAILKKGEGIYTLRRMDPFMPMGLNNVYQKLNSIDPDVTCRKNSRLWGGSDDIGGSPRGMPTKLTPEEIVQACRDAFQKTSFAGHTIRFLYALYLVGVILGAAAISRFFFLSNFSINGTNRMRLLFKSDLFFFAAMIFFTVLILGIVSGGGWRRFGVKKPTGKDWWLLLPVGVLAAFAKGVYVPQRFFPVLGFDETLLYMIFIIPLASELLFRSLAHGILAKGASTQDCRSRWFFSYPTVGSAVLYAGFIAYLVLFPNFLKGAVSIKAILSCLFAATAFGIAVGFVRERSQSVFPAILFHFAAIGIFVLLNFIS